MACVQLVEQLKENDLYEIFQSAYRQLHSTETALLRVQNDILQAVDSEGGAILVLLDLSAAFDPIDHQKLLDLLDYSFGIRGDALRWFKTYLQHRTQTVQIGSSTSEPMTLKYGVPQGSVLGPILFTMYTTPLGNIIHNHSLDFHLYADDTQIYISFKPYNSIFSHITGWGLHQGHQNMDDQQLVKIKWWQDRVYYHYHQWNYQLPGRHCHQHSAIQVALCNQLSLNLVHICSLVPHIGLLNF